MLHEGSIGPCGQPHHESTSDDHPDYSAEDSVCHACAILEEANESPSTEKGHSWYLEVTRNSVTNDDV